MNVCLCLDIYLTEHTRSHVRNVTHAKALKQADAHINTQRRALKRARPAETPAIINEQSTHTQSSEMRGHGHNAGKHSTNGFCPLC